MSSRGNQITENVIKIANAYGCTLWRNNTMGVFDGAIALRKIWAVVQSSRVTSAEIKKCLQSSYRQTHERKGATDATGYTRNGTFVAIEVKAKGDKLDNGLMQETFLNDVGQKNGIAFIVTEEPEKIKLRVYGSFKYITICKPDDFERFFKLHLDQPF